MKKIVIYLFLIQTIFSCKKEVKVDLKTKGIKKVTYSLNKILIDKSFFSVYQLSKNTTAIVINLNDSLQKTKFDRIFEYVESKDSLFNVLYGVNSNRLKKYEFFDTLGKFKLIRNELLEKEIKKEIKEKYYVYGTKGFSQMKVENIICGLDECRTNIIALTINNFDTIKNGKPLICSKQLLKLNYGKNYLEIEKKIEKFNNNIESDYTDNINAKVYANIGSTYFTYCDDFEWGKYPNKSKCKFPTRAIYKIEKNNLKIEVFWINSLDLFGIPCD